MAIVCTIDAAGITAPTLAEIRAYLVEQYQSIYGSDVYLESDSQDGELIDLFATSIHDANAAMVATYNAFSPTTAQGNGLSLNVKINGIARHVASYSTADLLIGGTAGTVITNGIARDSAGILWALPSEVVIPSVGQVAATATCQTVGDVAAAAGTITEIATPTRGWQTVTNPEAAIEGNPVESDADLRRRQARSTMIPSQTILEGIIGAVAAIPGVTRYDGIENDTGLTDANGIPAGAFSLVVEGGDIQTIAETIAAKKGAGTPTYGTTSASVVDAYGVTRTIKFMRPTNVPIAADIFVTARAGYTSNIGDQIRIAVAAWVNSLAIGEDVLLSKIFTPANLTGANAATFDISEIRISRDGALTSAASIPLSYFEAATCSADDITIHVA